MAVIRDFIDGAFKNDEVEPVDIGGFLTVARLRESVSKTREAPVSFLEDGSHVNDHIIRNPLTISIEGQVSNTYILPSPVVAQVRLIESQLGAISQYLPDRTTTQSQKVSALAIDVQTQTDRLDQAATVGQNMARYVGLLGDEGKTNIEAFIDFVDSAYESEALIKIAALFRTYDDMCITSIVYERDNTTNSLNFTLEAQQLRFARTLFVVGPAPNPSAATDGQTDGEADKGAQEGQDVPESFISSLLNRIKGQ